MWPMNIYEQPRSPVPNKKHQKSKDLSAREFSGMNAYYELHRGRGNSCMMQTIDVHLRFETFALTYLLKAFCTEWLLLQGLTRYDSVSISRFNKALGLDRQWGASRKSVRVGKQPSTFQLLSRADMFHYRNDNFEIGLIICCYFRPQGPALVVSSRRRLMKRRSSFKLSQHLLWNTNIQIFASPQNEPWCRSVSRSCFGVVEWGTAWCCRCPFHCCWGPSLTGFGFPLDQGARRTTVLYIGVS